VIGDAGGKPDVFGETVNVAARVQSAAEPDTVVITAATQRLVGGLFVVEDRGPQALKGVREPVPLYRVVQPSGVRSRLDVAAGRPRSRSGGRCAVRPRPGAASAPPAGVPRRPPPPAPPPPRRLEAGAERQRRTPRHPLRKRLIPPSTPQPLSGRAQFSTPVGG